MLMRNPYKRTDVFVCNFSSHAKFENRVSVYHVMQSKKCYPQGCIYFKWSCDLLDQGKNCVRGFNHPGRLCKGCTHFKDEKIHYQPKVKLSKLEYQRFLAELEDFEDWLTVVQDRELSIWLEVLSIKPRFRKEISDGRGQIRLSGYLIIANHGYIGSDAFDDYFYVYISPRQQEKFKIAPDDRFEARGILKLDRGRVLFPKIWSIDFEYRAHNATWNNSEALVARQMANAFDRQPEACLHCQYGALVDVSERQKGQTINKRELYCLKGIINPTDCYIAAKERINRCVNESMIAKTGKEL